jgi:AraC-like DNA-binding protein
VGRPNTRFTFTSDDIWLGEFNLPPADPAWDRPNAIGMEAPLLAIPRTTVAIRHEGRPWVVADPTRAICYAAGQPYRRGVLSADGDRCSFISFSHALAAEAASAYDPVAAADPSRYRFPFITADIGRVEYIGHQRVRRAIASGAGDRNELRESLYWMLARVVANGYAGVERSRANSHRRATSASHVEVTNAVRAGIGRRLDANITLDELAASAHMSPFHLSRVFREQTGRSIHAYRTEVRLRASLGRIADGERLADVAAAVGFVSQSHLTDKFRRAYGVTPGEWRDREKRRNVEAIPEKPHVA